MRRFLIYFSSVLLIMAVSCEKLSSDDDTISEEDLIPREDIPLTRTQLEYVKANNEFALELFKNVSDKEKGKSMLLSPLSVTLDFGMVNNGAVGETKNEINKTLGFGEDAGEMNEFCSTMLTQSAKIDPSTTIEIANAAVVNKLFAKLRDSFTKTVEKDYQALVCYKDFSKDDVKSFINNWCDQKTHGMIPELLKDQVSPMEYAHFLNATYFKGIWSHQFKKSDSRKESFNLEGGSTISVNMMRQEESFDYGETQGLCQILCLPYGNQAYRMLVFLPFEGKTIEDVKSSLDSESWNKMTGHLYSAKVNVKLPSFETEYKIDELGEILQDMGIKTAFTGDADFSQMTETPIHIDKVIQKAKIKVDEQGTEAAAVTDIVMKFNSSAGPSKIVDFHADRPFLYAITEVSTGAIFFIGQYTGK